MIVYAGSARGQFVHGALLVAPRLLGSVSLLRQMVVYVIAGAQAPSAPSLRELAKIFDF